MDGCEEEGCPIPIPKGSYNFNFDEFDENTNPFQSKSKIGCSPPVTNSEFNPFQSKNKLSSTPPNSGSYQPPNDCNENQIKVENCSDNTDVSKTECDSKPKKGSKKPRSPDVSQDALQDQQEVNCMDTSDTSPQKESTDIKSSKKNNSPKKGLKKPKKFKPPANFGIQGGDIEIFVPPPKETAPKEDDEASATKDNEVPVSADHDVANQMTGSDIEVANRMTGSDIEVTNRMTGSDIEVSNQMAGSLEMVHDFGAGEMPDEENEGFATSQDVIDDQAAWEMLDKYGTEGKCEEAVEGDLTNEDISGEILHEQDLITEGLSSSPLSLMTTPKSSSRVPKHPAARVLEENVEENGNPVKSTEINKSSSDETDDGQFYDAYEFPPKQNAKSVMEDKSPIMDNNIVQLVQVLKYSQSDWNKMKQELELDFQAKILNKEREWSQKLGARDKVITELQEQNKLFKSANDDMRGVVAEFEKTIAQLQAEKERSHSETLQSFDDVVKERDQALEDLQGVEASFSDLHRRYEKTKGVVEGFKKNEEVLKKCIQDYQGKLKKAEEKLQDVIQEAEEKLSDANNEMERTKKSAKSDIARLEAAARKSDLQVQSLQKSLEQKIRENEELTSICDELIAKVGH